MLCAVLYCSQIGFVFSTSNISDFGIRASDFQPKAGNLALLFLTPLEHYFDVIICHIYTYVHLGRSKIGFVFSKHTFQLVSDLVFSASDT